MLRVAVLIVKAGSARWKTVYRVHLNGGRAVSFLRLLHPYMGERREAQIQALMDCYKPRYAYPHDTYTLIRDQWHDLDRYWIAGLCEGEGYFTRTRDTKPYGTYFYSEVVISSTDLDVVRRSQQIICTRYEVDVKIHSPKQRAGKKIIYRVQVSGRGAKSMMEDLYPLMGERRQAKIQELLEHAHKSD